MRPFPNFLEPRLEAEQRRHKQGGGSIARTLEFSFDYGTSYSCLADTQVKAIATRAGATLARKPLPGGENGTPIAAAAVIPR